MLQELRNREHAYTCGYDLAPQRIQRGDLLQSVVQSYAFAPDEGVSIQAHSPHHRVSRHFIVHTHTLVSSPVYVLGVSEPACVVTFDAAMLVGNTAFVIEAKLSPEHRSLQTEARTTPGAVVQMRSARRSLAEKAQEELSEFEREYPW